MKRVKKNKMRWIFVAILGLSASSAFAQNLYSNLNKNYQVDISKDHAQLAYDKTFNSLFDCGVRCDLPELNPDKQSYQAATHLIFWDDTDHALSLIHI